MSDHGLTLPVSTTAGLISPAAEAQVFWRLRVRLLAALVRQSVLRHWFRLGVIVVISSVLWAGLFWMFIEAFRFLQTTVVLPDLYDQTVRALFSMFFVSLMVMLVFSSGILLYGILFSAQETAFLLTLPVRVERVFMHKFEEALLLSSWGFLLLGTPMLLAYGIVSSAPWHYYVMIGPLAVAFVTIPAALGAIICLWIVHRLPSRRLLLTVVAGLIVLGSGGSLAWNLLAGSEGRVLSQNWFQHLLGRLSFAEQRLLPSWWLSSGLLEAARDQWQETIMFLLLLMANALLMSRLAAWVAQRVLRAAYSGLAGAPAAARRRKHPWLDRLLLTVARPLPPQTRLLLVKDLRLFHRDPVQWSQFAVFFGLLALYFLNIRRFSYDISYAGWMNMISFLNVSVVGLLLSTFTTRFVFPSISLEGRRFWILGLLPIRRETVLWSKFWFAALGAVVPCSLLIVLSDVMLRVSLLVLVSHQLTCLMLSVGLAGLAVGLGAALPDLRDQSPARIAASEGGTLNLVIGTVYIMAVVLLTALPCHFYLALSSQGLTVLGHHSVRWWFDLWLGAGTVVSLLLTALAAGVPMWIGLRAFRRMEF